MSFFELSFFWTQEKGDNPWVTRNVCRESGRGAVCHWENGESNTVYKNRIPSFIPRVLIFCTPISSIYRRGFTSVEFDQGTTKILVGFAVFTCPLPPWSNIFLMKFSNKGIRKQVFGAFYGKPNFGLWILDCSAAFNSSCVDIWWESALAFLQDSGCRSGWISRGKRHRYSRVSYQCFLQVFAGLRLSFGLSPDTPLLFISIMAHDFISDRRPLEHGHPEDSRGWFHHDWLTMA